MTVAAAKKIINAHEKIVDKEYIPLDDAFQRVLADNIISKIDSPPFDRSAMDGYALKAEDTFGSSENNPALLKIVDRIGAGQVSSLKINNGEAVQIATGAPLPDGADAVVMEEYTFSQENELYVEMSLVPGENVSYKGEDIAREKKILKPGVIINASEIALIASSGNYQIPVHRKPKVGVIITGNELVMPTDQLGEGQIINSNHFTLLALLKSVLCDPILNHCQDDLKLVEEKFRDLLKNCDALITTGGTAISKGDVVVDVANALGEVLIHGVAIRPGKPFGYAIVDNKPVFMLSGYPVAAMVQFDVFVRESLLRMQGIHRKILMQKKIAKRKIPSTLGRVDYIRGKVDGDSVDPVMTKGSGIIRSMVESDCYIIIEENCEGISEGAECDVLPFHSLKV